MTKIEFPHFQEVEGKKRVTVFSLEVNEQDMSHTITVCFDDKATTLNAHDAVKLLAMLEAHHDTFAALSEQLNSAAWLEDMRDQEKIRREWQEYRNEGLGSAG